MNGSCFDFPYPIRNQSGLEALRNAALAVCVILGRSHVVHGATYVEDRHQANKNKTPRDLYNDADSEQGEGVSDPTRDPLRESRTGTLRPENVERPGEAAPRRR